jgi:predicted outer membrane protein
LQRARNPKVQEFAGFENAEQTTIAQVLTDRDSPTPPALEPSDAAILQPLQQIPEGPQFDNQYVSAQLQVHHELWGVQQAFLKGVQSMASDPVHIAMLARTVIQMHIQMLQGIQGSLRT